MAKDQTIKEFFSRWDNSNPLIAIMKGNEFRQLCENAKSNQGVNFFCWLVDSFIGITWTVGKIINLLQELGFSPNSSINDLVKWLITAKWNVILQKIGDIEHDYDKQLDELHLEYLNKIKNLESNETKLQEEIAVLKKQIIPSFKLNYDNLTTITATGIMNLIKSQTYLEPNAKWNWLDNTYKLFPESQLDKFEKTAKFIANLKYVSERRDCDDYATMLRGYLSYEGYGNLTVPMIEVNQYDSSNKIKSAHAINLVITDKHRVLGYEPQLSKTFDMKKPEPYFIWEGIVRQKIRKLII